MRPDGNWKYHSTADEVSAQSQIEYYMGRHKDTRLFDYRIVSPESAEALAKPADPTYVMPDRATFSFGRLATNNKK